RGRPHRRRRLRRAALAAWRRDQAGRRRPDRAAPRARARICLAPPNSQLPRTNELWGWAPLTWPDRSVDLDVAAAELVVAGVVAVAQADPVVVVRAGLAVVDDVDLVTDRGRSVERRLTEDARFRRTRARDRDDAGRVHVRG